MEEGGLYGERVTEEDSGVSDELEADRIMEEWKEQQDQVRRCFKYISAAFLLKP